MDALFFFSKKLEQLIDLTKALYVSMQLQQDNF